MPDNSKIFIFYSCNEWKEYSSMRFIAASTGIDDIYKAIRSEIQQGNMDYDSLTKRKGVKLFNEDLDNNRFNLDLLDYGYLEEHKNLASDVNSRQIKNKTRRLNV